MKNASGNRPGAASLETGQIRSNSTATVLAPQTSTSTRSSGRTIGAA
jgi:hypothetical protein